MKTPIPVPYATRQVKIGATTYTVRELSLEEFEIVQARRAVPGSGSNLSATVEMVKLGLVEPELTDEQVRKIGLGTMMKLSTAILVACGIGEDEKKADGSD